MSRDVESHTPGGTGDGDDLSGWPVALRGVTESVVTTLGPNGLWNAAALGIVAPGRATDDPVGNAEVPEATTWGNTRTKRNFRRQGAGYVQFTRNPVTFVDAALSIDEHEAPILSSADAWVRVNVQSVTTGETGGTEWERWALRPVESGVHREVVPTTNRGFAAVIEATVAASRLAVSEYDREKLRRRLAYCTSVVERAGGPLEREAMSRVRRHSSWEPDGETANQNEWL